jgi:DNA repair exonuclease SbcCD nuclease subunit
MTVIAILISDIHLSHTPPIARNNEPDWYDAMARQLRWLKEIWIEHDRPPIIAAGDIFHRWNSPPELINFAIQHLPTVYAVPGQHDMPFHSIKSLKKSAYWTLVEAGNIIDITPNKIPYHLEFLDNVLCLHGFPFGVPLQPNEDTSGAITEQAPFYYHIAVIHDYCWQSDFSYPGASQEKSVEGHLSSVKGHLEYDILHFGDNHKGFIKHLKNQWIFNGGTFYRRSVDESEYRPMVGLVIKEERKLRIEPFYVPVKSDILTLRVQETDTDNVEIGEFVEYLSGVSINDLDIEAVIEQYMNRNGIPDAVRVEITKLLECTRHG